MIEYYIGVDGGGTGTRVRVAGTDGVELSQGQSGPSGLAHGIDKAWRAVEDAITAAFAAAALPRPPRAAMALGLGLAGVHNRQWANAFAQAEPGYAALRLETDAFTTLMGAHDGRPGAIVAIGTGSVGEALRPDGSRIEVGGWGFPAGDEAGGAWMGLRAVTHAQQTMDGRQPRGAFADAVVAACGGSRDSFLAWLGDARQTAFASLAPLVQEYAAADATARAILAEAGQQVAAIARALDPTGQLPLALCGGLANPLRQFLPQDILERSLAPKGDAARGALRMIQQTVQGASNAQATQ